MNFVKGIYKIDIEAETTTRETKYNLPKGTNFRFLLPKLPSSSSSLLNTSFTSNFFFFLSATGGEDHDFEPMKTITLLIKNN